MTGERDGRRLDNPHCLELSSGPNCCHLQEFCWAHLQKKHHNRALLTVDIFSQKEQAARVMGASPVYPAALPTHRMQFCSNCRWPQGLGEALENINGKGLGAELHLHSHGKMSSVLGIQFPIVTALRSSMLSQVPTHLLLCKETE